MLWVKGEMDMIPVAIAIDRYSTHVERSGINSIKWRLCSNGQVGVSP